MSQSLMFLLFVPLSLHLTHLRKLDTAQMLSRLTLPYYISVSPSFQ